jgi:hypothetical protein
MVTNIAKVLSKHAKKAAGSLGIKFVGENLNLAYELSDSLIDELLDECKPTKEEYSDLVDGVPLTPGSIYRLFMEAKDKWGNAS